MDADALLPAADVPSAQSGEELGFSPDARVLIVNCDDFGMYPAINTAVVEAIEHGIASSCSLMPVCPGAPDAVRRLRRRPSIPFGIHLSLVCEMPRSGWGPMAPKEKVPSLLDGAGHLFAPTPAGRAALLRQARLDEVEVEFRTQIDAVADAGLTPTHLDFHCLADGGRADILDLGLGLAAEYRLAVRVWQEPGRRAARRRGLPVVDNDFLDSFSLDIEGKAERWLQRLRDLPAGLTEWAVHPSIADQASRAVDDGWLVRHTDYLFLTSPQAHEALRQEGIVVIDYRPLQRAWTQITTPR